MYRFYTVFDLNIFLIHQNDSLNNCKWNMIILTDVYDKF